MNTCYYSEGGKHDCCNHSHYCIFNPKRAELESKITKLEKKLAHWRLQLSNIISGDCYTSESYATIKKNVKLLENDLRELRLFEFKVINGDIDGYGFLES